MLNNIKQKNGLSSLLRLADVDLFLDILLESLVWNCFLNPWLDLMYTMIILFIIFDNRVFSYLIKIKKIYTGFMQFPPQHCGRSSINFAMQKKQQFNNVGFFLLTILTHYICLLAASCVTIRAKVHFNLLARRFKVHALKRSILRNI